MNRLIQALLALLFAVTAPAASVPHYLSIVNDAQSTVRSFEVRAARSDQWRSLDVGEQRTSSDLHPGASVQVALRDGCTYDFRVVFADSRSLTVKDFNACKLATFHPGSALRRANALAR